MDAPLTLREWLSATTEQRQAWLEQGRCLDDRSRQVLLWAQAFRRYGAVLSDEGMLVVYNAQIG